MQQMCGRNDGSFGIKKREERKISRSFGLEINSH